MSIEISMDLVGDVLIVHADVDGERHDVQFDRATTERFAANLVHMLSGAHEPVAAHTTSDGRRHWPFDPEEN